MTLGVDLSNYTTPLPSPNWPAVGWPGGSISDANVACWRGQGLDHAVAGTQWPDLTGHQLATATRGGMSVEAYHWLWFARDFSAEIRRSVRAVENYPIGRLWIDIEDSTAGFTIAQRIGISEMVVAEAEALLRPRGIGVGIYTGRWWWVPYMGNYDGFAHLPLWHAEYHNAEGRLPPPGWLPSSSLTFGKYGGWQHPAMWQYAGSVGLCGTNLDLNELYYDPRPETAPEEEPDMISWLAWDVGLERVWMPGQVYEMNARAGLGLPEDAKTIDLSVQETVPHTRWYHANTGMPALPIGTGRGFRVYRINLDESGKCRFDCQVQATIRRAQSIGYYR